MLGMIETLDLLLSVYPFEKKLFDKSSLRVEYIGNPLVNAIQNYVYNDLWQSEVGIESAGVVRR